MSEVIGYNPYETDGTMNNAYRSGPADYDQEYRSGATVTQVDRGRSAEGLNNGAGVSFSENRENFPVQDLVVSKEQALTKRERELRSELSRVEGQIRAVDRFKREVEFVVDQMINKWSLEQLPDNPAGLSELAGAFAKWLYGNNLFFPRFPEEQESPQGLLGPFTVNHIPDYLMWQLEKAKKLSREGKLEEAQRRSDQMLGQLGEHIKNKLPESLGERTGLVDKSWDYILEMQRLADSLELPPKVRMSVMQEIGRDSKLAQDFEALKHALYRAKQAMENLGEKMVSNSSKVEGDMDGDTVVQNVGGHAGEGERQSERLFAVGGPRRRIRAIIKASIMDAFSFPLIALKSPKGNLELRRIAGSHRWVSRELAKIASVGEEVLPYIKNYVLSYRKALTHKLLPLLTHESNNLRQIEEQIETELKAIEAEKKRLEIEKRRQSGLGNNGHQRERRITSSLFS